MSEHKVLSAIIQSGEAFDTVKTYHEDGDFSDLGELVYKEVAGYYSRDPDAEGADVESIKHRLEKKYPKHADKFAKFIEGLGHVSVANIMEDYRELKRCSAAEIAGSYLLAGEYDKADEVLEKYTRLGMASLNESEDAPCIYHDADADDFLDTVLAENRIPIAPTVLNEYLGGGLIAGSHTLIYAPPETGKTAVAINLAYGTARAGKLTMYFGNEESADMYLNRLLCRFCRWPLSRVQANRPRAMEIARENGWGNLIFIHLSPGSVDQVQSLIKEYMPDVVVIDQLSNLLLGGKGKPPEKTQLLERLAYQMRMFYSRYKIAGVSMSQADEKAIGKLYLTIKDVYYSNIGVQGMCDAMIGIGMNHDYESMDRRMLCITKNKLGGQHVSVPVQIYREISMLKGI